jgi:penicillin-binding protein 1A
MSEKKSRANHRYTRYVRIFWLMVIIPLTLLVLVVIAAAKGMFGDLPTFEDLENPKSALASEVYSADGILLGKYYFQNRTNIHYYELAHNLIDALKATEDIRFESHSGIDLRGLARVLFKTVILRQSGSGGGSTITQQLAKNLFPRERISGFRLFTRKIQEWIIAVRLERNYTKDEIIAMYLNTVEFGSNSFGIKSAAQTFFGKSPSELDVEESAVLVGLLKAPTYYSPVRNPENSTRRRNTVLGQMKKYNLLTPEAFDSLITEPIKLNYQAEDHNIGTATYFREYLRQYLTKWCNENLKTDGTKYNIYRDGLKIYTTIDSRMQRYAEEAVKEHLTVLQKTFFDHWKGREAWSSFPEVITDGIKRSARYHEMRADGISADSIRKVFDVPVPMTVFSWNGDIDTVMSPLDSLKYYKMFLRTGMMSMEPFSGHVKAWVGGGDYRHFKYDHVREGRRQVGSTFKPFVYTLAMQEGYSPCYKVPNVRVTFVGEDGKIWSPVNSDGKYGGMLSLKEALAESVNSVTAFLMKQFGPQAVIDVARKMGITAPMDPFPAICLGTPDISVYEMVGAYSAFANKGVWTEPVFITRIEDKNGVVLQEFVPRKVEALNEETAFVTLSLLKGVVEYGTGMRLRFRYKLTNPIAGKTGTTQNQSDGWFVGITPELVSGVWVGCEDRSIHFRTTNLGQGANTALPIWGLYMQKVYADGSINLYQGDFEKPEGRLSIELDCSKYNSANPALSSPRDFGF